MGAGTLPLQIWLSPAFPVGSFAYSHGLEWAVEAGAVHDAASVQAWLEDLIGFGAIHTDTILASLAWRAVAKSDLQDLVELNALALALAGGRERYLETSAQGSAFVKAASAAWPCAILADFHDRTSGPVAYPIALGMVASGHEVALSPMLEAFALAFAAMILSAAVRLGPIGQTQCQQIIAFLLPRIKSLAELAEHASLTELGACAFTSDIAALRHETQYSRLFRT